LAESRDTLAHLLWKVKGGDRARSADLARKAVAGYTITTPEIQARKKQLRAWMTERGIAP